MMWPRLYPGSVTGKVGLLESNVIVSAYFKNAVHLFHHSKNTCISLDVYFCIEARRSSTLHLVWKLYMGINGVPYLCWVTLHPWVSFRFMPQGF